MRAIIGPNGAGKTTMMDVITGKTRADTGTVLFQGGVDLNALDETAIARLGIGRKFQKPTVFEALTVAENLALALQGGLGLAAAASWRPGCRGAGADRRGAGPHRPRRPCATGWRAS